MDLNGVSDLKTELASMSREIDEGNLSNVESDLVQILRVSQNINTVIRQFIEMYTKRIDALLEKGFADAAMEKATMLISYLEFFKDFPYLQEEIRKTFQKVQHCLAATSTATGADEILVHLGNDTAVTHELSTAPAVETESTDSEGADSIPAQDADANIISEQPSNSAAEITTMAEQTNALRDEIIAKPTIEEGLAPVTMHNGTDAAVVKNRSPKNPASPKRLGIRNPSTDEVLAKALNDPIIQELRRKIDTGSSQENLQSLINALFAADKKGIGHWPVNIVAQEALHNERIRKEDFLAFKKAYTRLM